MFFENFFKSKKLAKKFQEVSPAFENSENELLYEEKCKVVKINWKKSIANQEYTQWIMKSKFKSIEAHMKAHNLSLNSLKFEKINGDCILKIYGSYVNKEDIKELKNRVLDMEQDSGLIAKGIYKLKNNENSFVMHFLVYGEKANAKKSKPATKREFRPEIR